MAVLDILQKMFGQSPVAAPQQQVPTGDASQSPIMQFLQQAGLNTPLDPQEEKRRAISRGLLDFGKAMSSSTQDFLPALAGSIGEGATGYLDTKDASAEKKRTQNQDLMKQIFGLAGQEATGQYRNDALDQRTQLMQDKLDGIERHQLITEGQGAEKIDIIKLLGLLKAGQNDDANDETKRHHGVTEGQDADKIKNDNDPMMRKAKIDKLQAEIDKINRSNNNLTASTKYLAARSKAAQAILKMEEEERWKIKDDATQEEKDAVEARIAEQSKHILELHGLTGNSSVQEKSDVQTTAQPIPQPQKTPQQSIAPEGTVVTNSAGQKLIKKGGKWIPVP